MFNVILNSFIKALSHQHDLSGKYDNMIDQIETAALFFIGLPDDHYYFNEDE